MKRDRIFASLSPLGLFPPQETALFILYFMKNLSIYIQEQHVKYMGSEYSVS